MLSVIKLVFINDSGSGNVRIIQGGENPLNVPYGYPNLLDLLPRLASEISTKQMKIGIKTSILMTMDLMRFCVQLMLQKFTH